MSAELVEAELRNKLAISRVVVQSPSHKGFTMFALHTPQTITLAVPGEDGPFTTINFRTNGADTSRCVMEIIDGEGSIHRLTFTTRGHLVDQQYVDHEKPTPEPLTEADYIIDGRDIRADNPYTHQPFVDDDRLYRDGIHPGNTAPVPLDDDGNPVVNDAELREQAMKDAEENAKKIREDHAKRMKETADERRERQEKERAERLRTGNILTADDTTERDVAWDAPHDKPFLGESGDHAIAREQPQPIPDPANNPSVHGKVNTTESMTQPHDEFADLRTLQRQPEPQHE